MIASATRVHLRSWRYFIFYYFQLRKVTNQLQNTPGLAGYEVRRTQGLSFWMKMVWRNEHVMNDFYQSSAYQNGMTKLGLWCDEAVQGHWEQNGNILPTWQLVEKSLIKHGRLTSVEKPSDSHQIGDIVLR